MSQSFHQLNKTAILRLCTAQPLTRAQQLVDSHAARLRLVLCCVLNIVVLILKFQTSNVTATIVNAITSGDLIAALHAVDPVLFPLTCSLFLASPVSTTCWLLSKNYGSLSDNRIAPVDAPNNFVIGFNVATNTTILTWSAPDNVNGLTG